MPDNRRLGTCETTSVAGESVHAFIPPPLPPDPALTISPARQDLIEKANRGPGRPDGIAREATGRKRKKLYMYDAYLSILEEGAEPIK